MSVDWAKIRARLPVERTPEQKHKRFEMFKQFDPNGNGYLSLAEVDKGVRDILQVEEIFDAKPVMIRAFNAAKGANNAHISKGHNAHGADYIEVSEFRLLLVYLHKYLELWEMFEALDTSKDRRVSLTEFKAAVPKIQSWGVKIPDPAAAFKEIDANGGGEILFDEFSDWALKKHLDLPEEHFDDAAMHH